MSSQLKKSETIINFSPKRILSRQEAYFNIISDWYEALENSFKFLATTYNVSRIYLFFHHRNSEDSYVLSQVYEWTQENISKQIRNPLLQNFDYRNSKIHFWILDMMEGKYINKNLEIESKNKFGILTSQNIKSLLMIPVFKNGKYWGIMGLDNCHVGKKFTSLEIQTFFNAAKVVGKTFNHYNYKLIKSTFPETSQKDKGLLILYKNILLEYNTNALEILETTNDGLQKIFLPNSLNNILIRFTDIKNKIKQDSIINIITKRGNYIELDVKYKQPKTQPYVHIFIFKKKVRSNNTNEKNVNNNQAQTINTITSNLFSNSKGSIQQSLYNVLNIIKSDFKTSQTFAYKFDAEASCFYKIYSSSRHNADCLKQLPDSFYDQKFFSTIRKIHQTFIHLKVNEIIGSPFYEFYGRFFKHFNTSEFILEKLNNNENFYFIFHLKDDKEQAWSFEDLNSLLAINKIYNSTILNIKLQTKLLETQQRTKESESNIIKLINKISTETLNPLNIILGYADLLTEEDLGVYEKLNYNRIIQAAGTQLSGLVKKVNDSSLIYSSSTSISREYFSISDLTNNVIRDLERQSILNKTKIILDASPEIEYLSIYSDPKKIFSILYNVLENAITYSSKKLVYLKAQRLRNLIKFSIQDQGPGIKGIYREKVFEEFFTIKHDGYQFSGSGLGLFITKKHIDALGGKIWFESTIGKGTTFYITLPCPIDNYDKTSLSSLNERLNSHKITILVFSPYRLNYYDIEKKFLNRANNLLWTKELTNLYNIVQHNREIDLVILSASEEQFNFKKIKRKIHEYSTSIIVLSHEEISQILIENKSILNSR